MMDFQHSFNLYLNTINDYLHLLFDKKEGRIYDAMRYSIYAGGKRIRPMLSLACCDALNGDSGAALSFGCALEMIHTYSLIHDDLPCMDNDDLRRGKPTNHVVFGEAIAVLSGDALLNYACESIISSEAGNTEMKLAALEIIYKASGTEGMIGGQVLDMEAEQRKISEAELITLQKKKTGALICAGAALGTISAGREERLFDEYASHLGLAFQIRDDILDVQGDVKVFGKPILSDEKNNKTTYVSLYGLDGAQKRLEEETEKAIASLDFLGEKQEFLKHLALYLLKREN